MVVLYNHPATKIVLLKTRGTPRKRHIIHGSTNLNLNRSTSFFLETPVLTEWRCMSAHYDKHNVKMKCQCLQYTYYKLFLLVRAPHLFATLCTSSELLNPALIQWCMHTRSHNLLWVIIIIIIWDEMGKLTAVIIITAWTTTVVL